jgi:hypothetical protein
MEIPAGKLDTGVVRIDIGCRRGPDKGLARTVPAQQNSARRCRIAQTVVVSTHRVTCLAERHAAAIEEVVKSFSRIVRPAAPAGVERQAPQRKHG